MRKAVVLYADGIKEVIDIEEWTDVVQLIQSIVDGYFTYVSTTIGADMWVNEDGWYRGLPINDNATELYDPWLDKEPIVGNALLTNVNDSGEVTGLTDAQIAHLMR